MAWFEVGGFQLQPSEFAKVTLILILAAYLGSGERADGLPFNRFVVALIIAAIPMGLTLAQPDLGTASVMVAILMGILLVAGAQTKHILVISVMALLTIGVLVGTGQLDKYQQDRLLNFLRSNSSITVGDQDTELEQRLRESARQVENSETAISRGGLTGEGFLEGQDDQRRLRPRAAHRLRVRRRGRAVRAARARWSLLALVRLAGLPDLRTAQLAGDLTGHAASPRASLVAAGVARLPERRDDDGHHAGHRHSRCPCCRYGGSATVAFLLAVGLVQNVHMRRFV